MTKRKIILSLVSLVVLTVGLVAGVRLIPQVQEIREKAAEIDSPQLQEVVDKYEQALNAYETTNDSYQKALDGVCTQSKWDDTPSSCAEQQVKLFIGSPPSVLIPASQSSMLTHKGQWAVYRKKAMVHHWILADYYKFKYDTTSGDDASHKKRIAAHVYGTLLNWDYLTTGNEHEKPLSGHYDMENTSPCYRKSSGTCAFDTRTFVTISGKLIESITVGPKAYNYNETDKGWQVVRDLASVSKYKINNKAPCYGKSSGTCTFDTRTFVTIDSFIYESITVGNKAYNYQCDLNLQNCSWLDMGDHLLYNVGAGKYKTHNFSPCKSKSSSTCIFDTRTFVNLNVDSDTALESIESVTVGPNAYNYVCQDVANPSTCEWMWGALDLASVAKYAGTGDYSEYYNHVPCKGKSSGTCTFNTRTFATLNGKLIESITSDGKAFNYNETDNEWWNMTHNLTGIARYKEFVDSVYTLRDTYHAERYTSDGTGVFSGLVELKKMGLIPSTFCTSKETPFDAGKNCKTINLHNRLKTISSCQMVRNEVQWMYDDANPGQLREKYYDLSGEIADPDGHRLTPNTNTSGIPIALDLANRTCHVLPEYIDEVRGATWDPHFFFYMGQMTAMTTLADLLKDEFSGSYSSSDLNNIIKFGKNAVSHRLAADLNNYNNGFINYNEYGKPVRAYKYPSCDGTLSGSWGDPNNPPDCVGGSKELLGHDIVSDQPGWQYIAGILEVVDFDWSGSVGGNTEIMKNLPYLKRQLLDTYNVDGNSLVILNTNDSKSGSFDESVISSIIPNRIGSCGQLIYCSDGSGSCAGRSNGQACSDESGTCIANWYTRSNYAHEAVNTHTGPEPFLVVSGAAFALLSDLGDTESAQKHIDLTNQMLDAYLANIPDPRDVTECWTKTSNKFEIHRHLAFYRQGYYWWKKYAQSNPTLPPSCSVITEDVQCINGGTQVKVTWTNKSDTDLVFDRYVVRAADGTKVWPTNGSSRDIQDTTKTSAVFDISPDSEQVDAGIAFVYDVAINNGGTPYGLSQICRSKNQVWQVCPQATPGDTSTKLTDSVSAGSSTVNVASTSDFPNSGTAWITSSVLSYTSTSGSVLAADDNDVFTYTNKTSASFNGIPTSGEYSVLSHEADDIVISSVIPTPTPSCTATLDYPKDRSPFTIVPCGSISVAFSWSSIAGARDYGFQLDRDFNGLTCGSNGDYCNYNVAGTSITRSVSPGYKYRWRVRTDNACGAGIWSPWEVFEVPPAASSLTLSTNCNLATSPGEARVTASWNSVTGSDKYLLRRCTGSSCSPKDDGTNLYVGSSTSYNDQNRQHGTTYKYRVLSWNDTTGIQGCWSNTRSTTINCPIPTPTNTPTPGPPTPTPTPAVCETCGDRAPCSNGKSCDVQKQCILLSRNQKDCDCNANCSTGFCWQDGTSSPVDYCCYPGEVWDSSNGCHIEPVNLTSSVVEPIDPNNINIQVKYQWTPQLPSGLPPQGTILGVWEGTCDINTQPAVASPIYSGGGGFPSEITVGVPFNLGDTICGQIYGLGTIFGGYTLYSTESVLTIPVDITPIPTPTTPPYPYQLSGTADIATHFANFSFDPPISPPSPTGGAGGTDTVGLFVWENTCPNYLYIDDPSLLANEELAEDQTQAAVALDVDLGTSVCGQIWEYTKGAIDPLGYSYPTSNTSTLTFALPTSTPIPTPTNTPIPTATSTPLPTPPPGTNILSNGSFEGGLVPWVFNPGSAGSLGSSSDSVDGTYSGKVVITDDTESTQLFQKGFPLEAGTTYRLSFSAKSNTGHDLEMIVHRHSSPYTNYGLSEVFDLTSSWKSFSTQFTTLGFTGSTTDTRLRVWFKPYDAVGDIYYLDNVVLEKMTTTPTEPIGTPVPVPGDANEDGKIDGEDFVVWLFNYGQEVANGPLGGDFDGNGKVDGGDFVIWLMNYGNTTSPTPTPTSTPTPIPTATPTICPYPGIVATTYPNGDVSCGITSLTFQWENVPDATLYALRIDQDPNSWSGTCQSINEGDTCITMANRSYTRPVTPGKTYKWWVHAINACGWSPSSTPVAFSVPVCPGITPTPTPAECKVDGDCPLGECTDGSTYQKYSCANGECISINYFRDPCEV